MALVKLISCHIRVFKNDSQLSQRNFLMIFFTISVCVQSKTKETNIFMFHQPMVANFYSDSDKFMASPFSFSVHNNPSLIIIIIIYTIFLSVVRSVTYSEFAMPVSVLDAPHLSLGLYTKAILEIRCPSLLNKHSAQSVL